MGRNKDCARRHAGKSASGVAWAEEGRRAVERKPQEAVSVASEAAFVATTLRMTRAGEQFVQSSGVSEVGSAAEPWRLRMPSSW